jgi:hypothetical protein
MFFYIDESGHTGLNIFDETQPFLYYGLLSSKTNIDILAKSKIIALRKKLGVDRLHAAELGNGHLIEIIEDIKAIKEEYDLKFYYYQIKKEDFCLMYFFFQVFDPVLNPVVPWNAYHNPLLSYPLTIKLSSLFDKALLEKCWAANTTLNNTDAEKILRDVCEEIINRVDNLPDDCFRQIITNTMQWTIKNTSEIQYNSTSKKESRQSAPNAMLFQYVMSGISSQLKKQKKKALKIVVDQQCEFNIAQKYIADFYSKGQESERMLTKLCLASLDLKDMPNIPLSFTSGKESIGLELVDIFLWISKRYNENKTLEPELLALIEGGKTYDVSLNSLEKLGALER